MSVGYFAHCKTLEEAHATWRGLAARLHPDRPQGDAEAFKQLSEEYSRVERLGTVKTPEGKTRPLLSVYWYPIERAIHALILRDSPVRLLSVSFTGGGIVGLCSLTGKGRAFAVKLNLAEYEDLEARTRRNPTGGCQVLVTEDEYQQLLKRKL